MRCDTQIRRAAAALIFAGLGTFPSAKAQLPDLGQLTQLTQLIAITAATPAGNTQKTGGNTDTSTQGTQTTAGPQTTAGSSTGKTTSTSSPAPTPTTTTTATFPANPLSTSNAATTAASGTTLAPGGGLLGAPTLAGVGIPTLIVPYTAGAPFMKKSSLPEGTVFIAVGAVLGLLGICVILWRAIVAWSVNRSVKRAAMASVLAVETKNPGGWASSAFKPARGFYAQAPGGSTLSLGDHHGSGRRSGDKMAGRHGSFHRVNNNPSAGSGLFFSPTAAAVQLPSSNNPNSIPMTRLASLGNNRSSTYLPAGYYASTSAQLAGGASTTTLGGSTAAHTMPNFAQPTSPGAEPFALPGRRASLQRPLSQSQFSGGHISRGSDAGIGRVSPSGSMRPRTCQDA